MAKELVGNISGPTNYERAVALGEFEGTELEYLESLKGTITPEALEARNAAEAAMMAAEAARTGAETAAAAVPGIRRDLEALEVSIPGTISEVASQVALRKFSAGVPGVGTQQVFSDVAVRGALKGRFLAGGDHIGNPRQPFGFTAYYDAATLGESGGDKVANVANTIARGDFTVDWTRPGGAPKWLWQNNDFFRLGDGTEAGKVIGITDAWARLSEIHVTSPNQTFTSLHALIAEGGVDPTGTGSIITGWLAPLKASGPTNNAGASIARAASFLVTSPAPGVADEQYAIYVQGQERSRFGGDILLNSDPTQPHTLNAYDGTVRAKNIVAGALNEAASAMLTAKSKADTDVVGWFRGRGSQNVNILNVGVDSVVRSFFDRVGRLGLNAVGAPADTDMTAGQIVFFVDASAGAMKLKAKMKDAAGTVTTKELVMA